MTLYVGTSGWAYPEWKPAFYPKDLPRARFLEHYGTKLTACELNATFYRRQEPATFERWGAETPDGFRFAVKAHRGLTHVRKGLDEERAGFLREFVALARHLGPKLGAILFQFPPTRARDDEQLARLLSHLEGATPFAVEFRHESWRDPEVERRIADAGGTVCVGDVEGTPPARLPKGAIGYVRLRAEHYEPEHRSAWRELLLAEAAGRDVYAFAKHEGTPPDDPSAGLGFAEWLVETATSVA